MARRTGDSPLGSTPKTRAALWDKHLRFHGGGGLLAFSWSLALVCSALFCGYCGAETEFSILEEARVLADQMKTLSSHELGVLTMQKALLTAWCHASSFLVCLAPVVGTVSHLLAVEQETSPVYAFCPTRADVFLPHRRAANTNPPPVNHHVVKINAPLYCVTQRSAGMTRLDHDVHTGCTARYYDYDLHNNTSHRRRHFTTPRSRPTEKSNEQLGEELGVQCLAQGTCDSWGERFTV
ncbi:VWFA and cache domain-containing protein 1 [Liparis tanakae]|uniref:VWFA and cache domain-containing protein 1 n=1 Tax=Liparis tanakae TaxID=230148 RepID=A0A4Z2FUQ4_9TELE|nr:VWFA and cache domain-containing protein 1 [Liparis tanakae]